MVSIEQPRRTRGASLRASAQPAGKDHPCGRCFAPGDCQGDRRGRRPDQPPPAERGHDLAVGPSLTHTEVKLNNVVGFANINNAPGTSITGAPTSYSNSQWLVGATLAAGATYFLTPSWFIDLGYSFTLTAIWNATYASPFTNTASGFNTVGVLSGSYTGGLNTHAITVSINRRF